MLPLTITGNAQNRKAALRRRRGSLTAIAERLGVSLGHVSRVVSGERRSPRLERAIARSLGMSLRQAFPEWYSDRERVA